MKRKFCEKRKKDRQKSPFTHFLYRHGKGAIPQTAKANCVFQLQILYVNDTQAGFRQGNLRIRITVRIHNKVHFSETKIKKSWNGLIIITSSDGRSILNKSHLHQKPLVVLVQAHTIRCQRNEHKTDHYSCLQQIITLHLDLSPKRDFNFPHKWINNNTASNLACVTMFPENKKQTNRKIIDLK